MGILMKNLFINKKVWKTFSEDEMENYINKVFNYYKENGFPYLPTDHQWRIKELNKLLKYDFMKCNQGEYISQTMHGLSLCWSFFPHAFNIPCNNLMTPLEAFENDELFIKVIKKRIQLGDNMSDSGIRKMLKMFTGVQSVSNFRPTACASILKTYQPQGGRFFDPCGGWGGRMLGSYLTDMEYICCEPSTKTHKGLIELSSFLNQQYQILHRGSETEFNPIMNETMDIIFTSPPYYNCEVYSDEQSQSCNKYKTKESWVEGFLKPMLKNSFKLLKKGKYAVFNIANVPSFVNLEEVLIQKALEVGFIQKDTIYLTLSCFKKGAKFKYEPIFVFQKN
jgi:16S rRNA G966 N2-methylase RsmD